MKFSKTEMDNMNKIDNMVNDLPHRGLPLAYEILS